jgi:chaperonin GroES
MTTIKLTPIKGRIIVKRGKPKLCSDGGIIYTGKEKEGSRTGEVLAIAPDSAYAGDIKVGNTVLFTEFAGNTIEHEGEKYYIVDEKLLLGVVE